MPDFTPATKAGITQGEFAWLAQVSRLTANKWFRGGGVHPLAAKRVDNLLECISAAAKAGDLPLSAGEERIRTKAHGLVRPKLATTLQKHRS